MALSSNNSPLGKSSLKPLNNLIKCCMMKRFINTTIVPQNTLLFCAPLLAHSISDNITT